MSIVDGVGRAGRRVWIALSVLWLAAIGCCLSVASCTVWAPGQAGRTPAEAVRAVLNSLYPYHDPELTRVVVYLADDDEDDLRQRLREAREQLSSQGTGYELAVRNFREAQTPDGATVTVDVAIVSLLPGPPQLFMQTQSEVWTFDTINDRGPFTLSHGWKVSAVRIPDICTVYYTSC